MNYTFPNTMSRVSLCSLGGEVVGHWQLGPEFLLFLWALADHAAGNKHPVPLPDLPVFSELARVAPGPGP